MGSWDETCAITQTPIRAGDPAVLAFLDREELFCISKTAHGPNDGDSLPPRFEAFGHTHFDLRAVLFIAKGTYNDYGWLNELPKKTNEDPRRYQTPGDDNPFGSGFNLTVFFHRDVWDEIVAKWPVTEDDRWRPWLPQGVDGPLLMELVAVCAFANRTRRDVLSGHLFRGMQSYGKDLKVQYKFLAGKVVDKAKRINS